MVLDWNSNFTVFKKDCIRKYMLCVEKYTSIFHFFFQKLCWHKYAQTQSKPFYGLLMSHIWRVCMTFETVVPLSSLSHWPVLGVIERTGISRLRWSYFNIPLFFSVIFAPRIATFLLPSFKWPSECCWNVLCTGRSFRSTVLPMVAEPVFVLWGWSAVYWNNIQNKICSM